MMQTPTEILEAAYQEAKRTPIEALFSALPDNCVQELNIIVEKAESQKAVLGVTITSIAYKVYQPVQDIRYHQDGMEKGYSGRTFDTKYVTPFLTSKFPHLAMAESAWLTRSLEQPHPYNFEYPGKIRSKVLKSSFLRTMEFVQANPELAPKMLAVLMGLMIQVFKEDDVLFANMQVSSAITIARIVDALSKHIRYRYGKGVVGAARIPVLAVYSVYSLLMTDVKRYSDKILAPLESHTSPDARSKSLGDIEVKNPDGTCFEAIEIKHNKPITTGMVGAAYRKIRATTIDRYYILTTSEPNFADPNSLMEEIEKYKQVHACQIIVNGVIPSLKYYLRLLSNPQSFFDTYTNCLEAEYRSASGIKKEHLQVWQEIRKSL
jgi:DNA (cytosine-5)-methyltransferase 1